MPLKTPKYNLTAFQAGDRYESTADRSRFTIIDNHLAFLADQVGDGKISGWTLSAITGLSVRLAAGTGIIDRYLTRTYGNIDYQLEDNTRYYAFIVRKEKGGGTGPTSSIVSVSYTDTTAPAKVTGVAYTAEYNSITLTWIASASHDLSHYNIYRSENGTVYEAVGTSTTTTYLDEDLEENTGYFYKVSAEDYSGNEGTQSDALSAATETDTEAPPAPSSVEVFPGNGTLQVFWNASTGRVDHYEASVQPIDHEGNNDGVASVEVATADQLVLVIPDLTNGQTYKITLKAVNASGVESAGIDVVGVPAFIPGPGEPSNLQITDAAVDSSGKVVLNIQWDAADDPYSDAPAYYLVTITPKGGEATDASIYTGTSISATGYTVTTLGNTVIHPIMERTEYIVKVQAVNDESEASRGVLGRIVTRGFKPPATVSNITFTSNSATQIRIAWQNSPSQFSHTVLNVTSYNTVDFTTDAFVIDLNMGRKNYYDIPRTQIAENIRFDVVIKVVDTYGNESEEAEASYEVVADLVFDTRPEVPTFQDAVGGQQITITWSPPDISTLPESLASYNIWRAPFQVNFVATDFTKVGSVDYGINHFIDYSAVDNTRYVYFVTSVTESNVESLNPTDDEYFSYPLATARKDSRTDLTAPTDVVASISGTDVNLTWTVTANDFDGYEILRSDGDKSAFLPIGTTTPFEGTYVDEDALLESGNYFYVVRKYRNDATIFVSEANVAPVGSLPLSVISVANGTITFDNSVLVDIDGMIDPIITATQAALNEPHHLLYNNGNDHRVELSKNLNVEDWETIDYVTFTTTTDISYTNRFVVYIDGIQSDLLSDLDKSTGTLVFESAIFDLTSDDEPPEVSVLFLDVPEVTGELPAELTGPFSAQQITRNTLSPSLFADLNHAGRMKENLVPVENTMSTEDGHVFVNAEQVGNATVFYDLIRIADDTSNYLAATSIGILESSNAGTQWEVVFTPPEPVVKLFYSEVNDLYFAITPSQVYQSNTFESWSIIDGLVGVKFIRDILEDSIGNVFISTTSGVFRYRPGELTKDAWDQTQPISQTITDCYAMRLEGGILSVSTNKGVYETMDDGETWDRSLFFVENAAIFAFATVDTTIFALTADRLWRLRDTDPTYSEVAIFSDIARKMQVFNDKLYISTNYGMLTTDDSLYFAEMFEMKRAFQSLDRNGKTPCATSLNVVNDKLFIGTEEMLFSSSNGSSTLIHADYPKTIAPTVLVGSHERQVGVFWNSRDTNVYFDAKVTPGVDVSIVTNYGTFYATNKGWADANYRTPVVIRLNGNEYRSSTSTFDIGSFGSFALPDFNERNSNLTLANEAYNELVPYMNGFTERAAQQSTFTFTFTVTSEAVAELFRKVEALKRHLYPSVQSQIVLPPITVTFTRTIPTAAVDDKLKVVITADATSGKVTIVPQIDKYTSAEIDILAVPVTNQGSNTHTQLEDGLEKVNSGLPSGLSIVQQSNILKMGLHAERENPGDVIYYAGTYQASLTTPCSTDWYDRINSTIDYESIASSEPSPVSIAYPICVTEIPDTTKVWVGGLSGLLSIDSTTYTITNIPLDIDVEYSVLSIYPATDAVYVLTTEGLFTVDPDTLEAEKDVEIELLKNTNNLIYLRESYIASTPDGLFAKKSYDSSWTKILSVKDATLSVSGSFVFCFGTNPDNISDTLCFTSVDGLSWSTRTTLSDILTNSVARKSYQVFYATTAGLYVQDDSQVNSDDASSNLSPITLADLLEDEEESAALKFNDVCADTTRVVMGVDDGAYWVYDSGAYTEYDSGMDTIHKVRLINDKIWLFGRDMVKIEDNARTFRLSTGEAIL